MANVLAARAWVEVDPDALRSNALDVVRAAPEGTGLLPMVKADAYGVGAERVVRALEPLHPWGYGVATVEEGIELRRWGVARPVVVFSPIPPESTPAAAGAGLTPTISDMEGLRRWQAACRAHGASLDFHVEIDTGMGRTGFDWRETGDWAEAVRREAETARWTGIFTHFHSADLADRAPTAAQWARFQDAIQQLPVSREELIVHAANSAAALRWPEFAGDLVRPGIYLYGGQPAPGVTGVVEPRPVVAVRARILLVRDVPPGTTLGYGATHVARTWERWGTLAIGYGDGLPRRLANRGVALVAGVRTPMIGRISMDSAVVDLTAAPAARPTDVATIIGESGSQRITVDEVAAWAETITYDILTGLGPRLPRLGMDTQDG
jgi:alanine racemase